MIILTQNSLLLQGNSCHFYRHFSPPKVQQGNAILYFCHLERRPREAEVERSGF